MNLASNKSLRKHLIYTDIPSNKPELKTRLLWQIDLTGGSSSTKVLFGGCLLGARAEGITPVMLESRVDVVSCPLSVTLKQFTLKVSMYMYISQA